MAKCNGNIYFISWFLVVFIYHLIWFFFSFFFFILNEPLTMSSSAQNVLGIISQCYAILFFIIIIVVILIWIIIITTTINFLKLNTTGYLIDENQLFITDTLHFFLSQFLVFLALKTLEMMMVESRDEP